MRMFDTNDQPLEMHAVSQNGDLYIILRGELVRGAGRQVEHLIAQHFNPDMQRLMINLREVRFIDSAGVGMLVAQKVRCARHGIQFVVLEPSEFIGHLFAVGHLQQVFSIMASTEALPLREQFESSTSFRPESIGA